MKTKNHTLSLNTTSSNCLQKKASRPTLLALSKKATTAALLMGTVTLFHSETNAASLADDNFTLSSGTDVSTINNTEATGVGTYVLTQNSNALSIVNPAFFGSSNALQTNQGTFVSYRAFNDSSTITLNSLNANERIILNFDIGFTADPSNSVSFGFVNQTDDINSVIYASVSLVDTNTSKGFMYRSGSTAMGAGLGTQIADDRWSEIDTAPSVSYNFQLEVQKESDGGFTLSYTRDDVLVNSLNVGSTDTWVTEMGDVDVTGIAFRNESGTASSNMVIDNLSVTVVPEPETNALILASLCGAVFIWMRRRRG